GARPADATTRAPAPGTLVDDRAGPRALDHRDPDDPGGLRDPAAGSAQRPSGDRARLAMVVGVPLPVARRRDRERTPRAGGASGRATPGRARRDRQLLGAASGRQARR